MRTEQLALLDFRCSLHWCHHFNGLQVWWAEFPPDFLSCETAAAWFHWQCHYKENPNRDFIQSHIEQVSKMVLGEFLHSLFNVHSCVRNLTTMWIFMRISLNFRWEAENKKHRQRGEPCLEWGEDTDTLSRLCFGLLTDKVLRPQYRGADSWFSLTCAPPVPTPSSSRCSSSIWMANLWIPPPSSTWWWKTTRLLGKISECNTAEPGFLPSLLFSFGRRRWGQKKRLPNARLVWTRRGRHLFDQAAASPGAAVARG